jgi:hypothetical protein
MTCVARHTRHISKTGSRSRGRGEDELKAARMGVTFDTFKFARSLQDKADLTTELAEGIAEAFHDAATDQLTTKADLAALAAGLSGEIAGVKAELRVLKWMSGAALALLVVVLARLLLH